MHFRRIFSITAAAALFAASPASANDARLTSRPYNPDEVVRVEGKLNVQATIAFGEDEKIENVAVGDSDSWQIAPNRRADLLFVKPLAENARTNMTVVTDRHTYFFDLVASPTAKPIYALRFTYAVPASSVVVAAPAVAAAAATPAPVAAAAATAPAPAPAVATPAPAALTVDEAKQRREQAAQAKAARDAAAGAEAARLAAESTAARAAQAERDRVAAAEASRLKAERDALAKAAADRRKAERAQSRRVQAAARAAAQAAARASAQEKKRSDDAAKAEADRAEAARRTAARAATQTARTARVPLWQKRGAPALLPSRIFDDGQRTFAVWPAGSAIPNLFITNARGADVTLPYTLEGEGIVIAGTPERIQLRSGKDRAWLQRRMVKRPAPASPAPAVAASQ